MDTTELKALYDILSPRLSERTRRQFAGAVVKTTSQSSVSFVARSLGMSRNTVRTGLMEINTTGEELIGSRIRAEGGGRKRLASVDASLVTDLEALVDPFSRGDSMSPLRWTCKSTSNLSRALKENGHNVSPRTVATLLKELDYSLQGNRKDLEGKGDPERNAQFNYINETVKQFHEENNPVISVDAKKKELFGNFKNNGKQWQPHGMPEIVNVYDFLSLADGRATPYGVFDIFSSNKGWVSVGIDHDTSSFAADSIIQWWQQMGMPAYPNAKKLLITADGAGSNGSRTRLWKLELQRLANTTGLDIHVRHFPPGTSKWNKIEHRMFASISMNWRGEPLRTFATVVNLIGATSNQTGLKVKCQLNTNAYPLGVRVSDQEMKTIFLTLKTFHSEWNYSVTPNRQN